ncbi:hypothetical protein AX15_006616 [Amanita polypyramis BW_CC]|nr:hypothetical protein AX15_006616 [Amanita polypyramis BW_CC]
MRNRLVSDYIYKKTGKRRTAKQVGSRIQQLRDSCAGKKLLELLRPSPQPQKSPRRSTSPIYSQDAPGNGPLSLRCDTNSQSDASSPTTPQKLSPASCDDQVAEGKSTETDLLNVIYIDIVPPDQNSLDLATDSSGTCHGSSYPLSDHALNVNYVQISQQPRHLRYIDPTVALISQTAINANSFFTVRVRDTVIFTEVTALVRVGPLNDGESDGPQLYRTTLVPGYWETISNSADPSQYIIEQKVHRNVSAASASPLFSAIYKFRFAQEPQAACSTQPYQQPSEISQNVADSSAHQYSHLPTDCFVFNMPPLFDSLEHLISFDEDDMLTDFGSLNVQQTTTWASDSPSAQSNSSIPLASGASSPYIAVSPAGSCLSATPSTSASLIPSPTLYPISNGSCLAHGPHSIQSTLPDKPDEPDFYLKPFYSPQDFLDNSTYVTDINYVLQSQ